VELTSSQKSIIMSINTNTFNKIRYTLYAPGYDMIGRIFAKSRRESISRLNIQPGDKVLLVGAGTGLDLEFLPVGAEITATDITPAMISKVIQRNKKLKLNLTAVVMDGHKLEYPDGTFDKIILHLIIAVIPDPVLCLKESARVLKPGGKIAIFDKFVAKDKKVSIPRKLLNYITSFLFSDITRHFETIAANTDLITESDINADFGGQFRIITMRKG
jgi:phosphatidylethanolamine/phosphatidyl-N-methylethanolamine N-methyltransferase